MLSISDDLINEIPTNNVQVIVRIFEKNKFAYNYRIFFTISTREIITRTLDFKHLQKKDSKAPT
jgi:hypothetical protein